MLVLALGAPSAAQSPPQTGAASAQSYFEFLLARRLEAQGDTAGALEALKRAQQLDPKSAEVLAEMAGYYARQNNGTDAVDAAERALALDPRNAEAHRMLGMVFSAWSDGGAQAPQGRTQAQTRDLAIEHLTAILDTPAMATDLNLQLTLGRLQLRAGRADRALPILQNIVSQAPFAAEPYALLAEAHMAMDRPAAAIEALQAAAEINPRHNLLLAELYERQGQWLDAANAYTKGIANARGVGRDVRLRYFTALLNVPDGSGASKARDGLRDYLVTNPQDQRALFLLSSASLRVGDLAGAEEVARKLLAMDPGSMAGLHALSDALIARREFRKVVDLVAPFSKDVAARSKGREGDAALLLATLAHAHASLGEHDQAIAVLTTAVAQDPLSAPALNSLGYTLADRGQRLPEAVAFIERALAVDPENPSYLDSLGWAFHKQGRAQDAEGPLRKAAAALTTQSVVQDHFGDVLARLGKWSEAITVWQRALEGDGEEIDRVAIERKIKDARSKVQ